MGATSVSFVGALFSFAVVAACSGSTAEISPPADGGTPTPTPTPADGGPVSYDSGGAADSAADAASSVVVTEKPAPECNDLAQRGSLVTVTANPSAPPTPAALPAIPLGLFVVTASTEYQTPSTNEPPVRTTIDITPTRFYYVADQGRHDPLTTDWSFDAGVLTRTVLCRYTGIGQQVKHRVGASPNGFTIFTTSAASGRPLTVRYERIP